MQLKARNTQQLGHAICHRRKALKLSQGELAKQSGVSQPTISEIENGNGGNIRTVFLILNALGLEVELRKIDSKTKIFDPKAFYDG